MTTHPCKWHKGTHKNVVCAECGHEYCNQTWLVCPACNYALVENMVPAWLEQMTGHGGQ